MRNRTVLRLVAAVLLIALVLSMGVAAFAGEAAQATVTQDSGESPVGEIIPKPNSGAEPEEAGDRGGALQTGLLGLIGVAIATMVVHLARQSKGAREARLARAHRAAAERAARERDARERDPRERQSTSASHAATPSTKPDR